MLTHQPLQKDWWNCPVTGSDGLLDQLISRQRRQSVPESSLLLHHKLLSKAENFAEITQSKDSNRFCNQEFILLVKIKYLLDKNLGTYAGLSNFIKFFEVAIAAKDAFFKMEQSEMHYQGFQQRLF
ncbi:hypothetical protein [Neosynechococcus sphagnicola]|uniref:hypothetical protein n=1 Tax=Neosynechococcus sphagnicola TaxID=1501145 RepID=UPI0012E059FB|nr:hypothetical protein [Neosynechococcus sphagnicola]